jgi:hypothetical protein
MKKTITVALAGLLSASSAYSATTFTFTNIRASDAAGTPTVGSDAGAGTVVPSYTGSTGQSATGNAVVLTADNYNLFNDGTLYDIVVDFSITGVGLQFNDGVYQLNQAGDTMSYGAASITIFDDTGAIDLTSNFITSFTGYSNVQVSGFSGSDAGTINGDAITGSGSIEFGLSNVQTIDVVRTGGGFNINDVNGSFSIDAVPEPSATTLLGLGGLALILRRRK